MSGNEAQRMNAELPLRERKMKNMVPWRPRIPEHSKESKWLIVAIAIRVRIGKYLLDLATGWSNR